MERFEAWAEKVRTAPWNEEGLVKLSAEYAKLLVGDNLSREDAITLAAAAGHIVGAHAKEGVGGVIKAGRICFDTWARVSA